jgi:hypothetical protein
MPSATLHREDGSGTRGVERRKLVVSWEHPLSRAISPVGLLSLDGSTYTFDYLQSASQVDGFKPLLGFPELDVQYRSDELFPLFQQRVMDPKRPDYQRYVRELGIEDEGSPWEQIARSGGAREGDTLQLFPVPEYGDGVWSCQFLVHGMRYLLSKTVPVDGEDKGAYAPEKLEELLGSLAKGEKLELVAEPTNDYSDKALLVTTVGRLPLGYVPNFLLHGLGGSHADGKASVFVGHVNPPEAGWHLRLLAKLEVVGGDDFKFFEWQQS